jgi:hypothetical protein
MTKEDTNYLLDMLDKTHAEIRATIKGVDLETPVYEDGEWQIRDVIGHIAIWDREVVRSIRAYKEGREYSIPNFDEDVYNDRAALEMGELTAEGVFNEWEQAREEFKTTIGELSAEQLPGELLYPWGDERGSIPQLVEYMCDHDEEHGIDLQSALKGAKLV